MRRSNPQPSQHKLHATTPRSRSRVSSLTPMHTSLRSCHSQTSVEYGNDIDTRIYSSGHFDSTSHKAYIPSPCVPQPNVAQSPTILITLHNPTEPIQCDAVCTTCGCHVSVCLRVWMQYHNANATVRARFDWFDATCPSGFVPSRTVPPSQSTSSKSPSKSSSKSSRSESQSSKDGAHTHTHTTHTHTHTHHTHTHIHTRAHVILYLYTSM